MPDLELSSFTSLMKRFNKGNAGPANVFPEKEIVAPGMATVTEPTYVILPLHNALTRLGLRTEVFFISK